MMRKSLRLKDSLELTRYCFYWVNKDFVTINDYECREYIHPANHVIL